MDKPTDRGNQLGLDGVHHGCPQSPKVDHADYGVEQRVCEEEQGGPRANHRHQVVGREVVQHMVGEQLKRKSASTFNMLYYNGAQIVERRMCYGNVYLYINKK